MAHDKVALVQVPGRAHDLLKEAAETLGMTLRELTAQALEAYLLPMMDEIREEKVRVEAVRRQQEEVIRAEMAARSERVKSLASRFQPPPLRPGGPGSAGVSGVSGSGHSNINNPDFMVGVGAGDGDGGEGNEDIESECDSSDDVNTGNAKAKAVRAGSDN